MVASIKDWWKKQDTEVSGDPASPRSALNELPEDSAGEDLVDRTQNLRGTPSRMPTHDEIAKRAYEIYERNNRQDGRGDQNWLQAEQELTAEMRSGPGEDGIVNPTSQSVAESEF